MKLSDAANWAEIVSAIGLVISLVYVGIQITDNTSATRSETASNANSEFIDFYTLVASDAELTDVWLRGVNSPDTLTQAESVRFTFVLHTVMLQFQNNYYLVDEGTLDPRMLEAINNTLGTIRGTPGFDYYWRNRKALFFPEYQAYIETLMYEKEGGPNALYDQVVQ